MGSRRSLLWGSVTVAALLLGWSAFAAGGFRRYVRLTQEVDALKARTAKVREENARLTREIEALRGNRSVQERSAREELGFVKPGELVFDLEAP